MQAKPVVALKRLLKSGAHVSVACFRPRAVVGQWLLSGDGFGLLQYGGSDLRLAKFLIPFS